MKKNMISSAAGLAIVCFFTSMNAEVAAPFDKADSALLFLYDHFKSGADRTEIQKSILPFLRGNDVQITFMADRTLGMSEIQEMERTGVQFFYDDGKLLHTGPIYGAWMPFEELASFLTRKDILQVSSGWRPGIQRPLDVSIPEIDADVYWQFLDPSSNHCTGIGMVIADFDTGIDITHPAFFKTDGGVYNWIDVNGNGQFNSGTDAVDLDGDSIFDANERLRFFDGAGNLYGTIYWNDGVFNLRRDWLYNDANNDGSRQYGSAGGYTDSSPSFGERLFIVDDANGNNVLNTGEQLIGLGTSKVAYTLDGSGTERIRGANIINTPSDVNGHGTGVCGILAGQNYGTDRSYIGVAPDADLLVVDSSGNSLAVYVPWARNRSADAMLYEFSSYTWSFMDGSSNEEQIISLEATTAGYGSVQVVPAGNLADEPSANTDKHARANVPGSASLSLSTQQASGSGYSYLYMTLLWRDISNTMTVSIQNPLGGSTALTGGYLYANNFRLWSNESNSSRGTRKFDIFVDKYSNANVDGTWTLTITNAQGTVEPIRAFVADDLTSWSGGFKWNSNNSSDGTVTWPATADTAICLASYATRSDYSTPGALSVFSGRGQRIDGVSILDIAAPGNWDIWTAGSQGALSQHGWYNRFGGTSAAGPHVAGAAVLLMQKNPSWRHANVELEMKDSALSDAFTGSTPNDSWGYGKLRLDASILPSATPSATVTPNPTITSTPTPCLQTIFSEDFSSGTFGQFTNCTQATNDWVASSAYNGFECISGYSTYHAGCSSASSERIYSVIPVTHDCAEVSYCFLVCNMNGIPDTINVYVKCADGDPCSGGTLAQSHAGSANGVCTYYPGIDSGYDTFNVEDFINLCQSGCQSFYLIFEYACNGACVAILDTIIVKSDINGSCGCNPCDTQIPTSTSTPSPTSSPSPSPSRTSSPTVTPSPTSSPSPSPSRTPSPTATSTIPIVTPTSTPTPIPVPAEGASGLVLLVLCLSVLIVARLTRRSIKHPHVF